MKKTPMNTVKFIRNPLSQAIALACLTTAASSAMAATSCKNGSNTIDSAKIGACVLDQNGDDLTVTGSGSITSTVNGVYVYNAKIGDINNEGTIDAAYAGIYLYHSISGDIDNSGHIISSGGNGLYLYQSSVDGSISNSGTIDASLNGIYVYLGTNISGSIENSGKIISGSAGIYIYGGGYDSKVQIGGDVINSGKITSGGAGIYISNAVVGGDVENTGTMTTTGGHGVYIYNATVGGNFLNSGKIIADNGVGMYMYQTTLGGDLVNTGKIDTTVGAFSGIYAYNSNIGGSVINEGLIDSGFAGININNTPIGGDVINSGTILADDIGIYVYKSKVGGEIINEGTITSATSAALYVYQSTVGGDVVNAGEINSKYMGFTVSQSSVDGEVANNGVVYSTDGVGFYVYGSQINGSVTNNGRVTTDDTTGGVGFYVYESTVGGDVVNDASIHSNYAGFYVGRTAVTGEVVNTGNITATTGNAIYIYTSNIGGDIKNVATLTSGDAGFYVYNSSVGGDIINDGVITATDSAFVVSRTHVKGDVINTAEITSADYYGMYIYNSNVGGNVENSGVVLADDYAGLYLYHTTVGGEVSNTGTVVGYDGVYIYHSNINGDLINSGKIVGVSGQGIYVYGSTISGDVINTGKIKADTGYAGLYVYNSLVSGDVINEGDIIGGIYIKANADVTNSGRIDSDGYDSNVVGGDYSQTGLLILGASAAATHDSLTVDGNADLNGALALRLAPAHTIVDGDVLADLVVATKLTSSDVAMLDNDLSLGFKKVKDGATIDAVAFDTGLTTVGAVLGEYGDVVDGIIAADPGGDFALLFGSANSKQDLADAAEAALPALTGGAAQASLGFGDGMTNVIADHQQGMASGDMGLADGNVWVKVLSGKTDQSDRDGVSGYDIDSHGVTFGGDTELSSNLRLGAALGIVQSDTESKGADQKIDSDTVMGKVYATYKMDSASNLYFQAGYGKTGSDSSRRILNSTATASYDTNHYQLSAEYARSLSGSKLGLEPYVNLEYKTAEADGYTETGAGAFNVDASGDTAKSLVLGGGARGHMALTNSLQLTGNAGLGYDFLTDATDITFAYEGGGGRINSQGMEQSELVLNLGVGAKYSVNQGMILSLNYDLNAREDYMNHNLSLTAKYSLNGGAKVSGVYDVNGSEDYAQQDVKLKIDWAY